jgi:hypothetical protein
MPDSGHPAETMRVPIDTVISRLKPRVPAAPGQGRANPLTLATCAEQGPMPLSRPAR